MCSALACLANWYHLATPALTTQARDVSVYKMQRFSDHVPLIVG